MGIPRARRRVPPRPHRRLGLYFDGLTYRRTADGLEAWVVIGMGDGGTRPERFLYAPRAP